MPMLTVRLPADMEKRLSRLSQRTGRPKAYYAKKAIGEFLEEQEDYLIAISRLEDNLPFIPLAEVVKQLDQTGSH
jgi:RHH-type rel operon transcriptional repressor/antitoxin RelB